MYIIDTNVFMGLPDLEKMVKHFGADNIKIPVQVLEELDNLKTQPGDRGFKSRRAIRNIFKYLTEDNFTIQPDIVKDQEQVGFVIEAKKIDDIIIRIAKDTLGTLVTNDVGMSLKAKAFGIKVEPYSETSVIDYPVKTVNLTSKEYDDFILFFKNKWGLQNGDYLVINSIEGNFIERFKYLGNDGWDSVDNEPRICGPYLDIKPKDHDQSCAMDALEKDSMVVIVGPAGTGKTLLSLSYCLREISKGSKVHIFVNPVKTRGSEELGFYPGSRNDKLLQNFIGDILKNKIGSMDEVMRLMVSEKLNIYPISDIRGIEIPEGDIMYITEAQNLSVDLMKFAIQRCAEGSKIILEGDPYNQVDNINFSEGNNGLKRVIEVFRGSESFGYVHLRNIYRSAIAKMAELM